MTAQTMFATAPVAAADLPVRPYQRAALDAIHAAYRAGQRRQLISMPTGSGKTVTFAHLIKEMALRTVVVVHRDELVRQTVEKVQLVIPSLSTGVVKAERDELGADVIVASAQTLASEKRLERLLRALLGRPLLMVSDEAHHDRAASRMRTIERLNPELLTGWTATAMRGDGLGLDRIYGEAPVYHLPMIELIADGKLSPLCGLRIETEADLDGVHTRHGELAEDELAETVDTPGRNELIVRSWKQHASDRKRTVAFCVNVAHAEHLRDMFREQGIEAAAILGSTPTDERLRLFEEFHNGRLPVITNCMVLSEGYDEPAIDCILMARPTKSQGLYIQCVGRGARNAAPEYGKSSCLVLDFVDNSTHHKLITLPVLAGIDETDEDEAGPGPKPGAASEADREQGEMVDLLELAQKRRKMRERAAIAVNLFGGSEFVWRTVDGHYMASAGNGAYLLLLPRDSGFVPHVIHRRDKALCVRSERLFERPLDVETAMSLAESRIQRNALTLKGAGWRQGSAPPTPAQIDFARKLRIDVDLPNARTKGQLSALIDDAMAARVLKDALKAGVGA